MFAELKDEILYFMLIMKEIYYHYMTRSTSN